MTRSYFLQQRGCTLKAWHVKRNKSRQRSTSTAWSHLHVESKGKNKPPDSQTKTRGEGYGEGELDEGGPRAQTSRYKTGALGVSSTIVMRAAHAAVGETGKLLREQILRVLITRRRFFFPFFFSSYLQERTGISGTHLCDQREALLGKLGPQAWETLITNRNLAGKGHPPG